MSLATDKVEAEIAHWAKWARTQYPTGYGNSPVSKWDKPSFGTAFIDQSSETIPVPFELRHINRVIEHEIPDKHRRVIRAVFVRWFGDDIAPAIKRQMRAQEAGCSIGALDKIKDRSVRAVAVALCQESADDSTLQKT